MPEDKEELEKNNQNTAGNDHADRRRRNKEDIAALRGVREAWGNIKKSFLYKNFRASQLNPYHFGVEEVKADSLDKARRIIREKAKVYKAMNRDYRAQFIFNGTRYFADRYDCTPEQEYKEDGMVIRSGYEVSDRIPRNDKGELDLFAEIPIVIAINPMESPEVIGHACMQYKDQVVNRVLPSIHTDPLYPKYNNRAQYYFIYPSQIGINGKELYHKMSKHNIKYGDKRYDPLFNNCAQNVAQILKDVGVKDFDFYGPDFLNLSYATPGNNPFNKGLKAWCYKHGFRVHLNEMEQYDRLNHFTDVRERRDEMKNKRNRYRQFIKNNKNNRVV